MHGTASEGGGRGRPSSYADATLAISRLASCTAATLRRTPFSGRTVGLSCSPGTGPMETCSGLEGARFKQFSNRRVLKGFGSHLSALSRL